MTEGSADRKGCGQIVALVLVLSPAIVAGMGMVASWLN